MTLHRDSPPTPRARKARCCGSGAIRSGYDLDVEFRSISDGRCAWELLVYRSQVLPNGKGLYYPLAINLSSSLLNMKATVAVVLNAVFVALGATAVPAGRRDHGNKQTCEHDNKRTPTGPNGEPHVPGKLFDRFFMLIGENMDFWDVESQLTFANLWKDDPNGRVLANYYAATHPSQPNYFDHIAATTFGWNSDSVVNITGSESFSIVDLLEEKGISWGGYAENYPIT
ncbi:hypothetical protein V1515DRAFT_643596 [Lipomyces mesembrius]